MSVRSELEETVRRFNAKVQADPTFRKEVQGMNRKVNVDLGEETYNFILNGERIEGIVDGLIRAPPKPNSFAMAVMA